MIFLNRKENIRYIELFKGFNIISDFVKADNSLLADNQPVPYQEEGARHRPSLLPHTSVGQTDLVQG